MKFDVSNQWEDTDLNIEFVNPFSDVREEFAFYDSSWARITQSIDDDPEVDWESGANSYMDPLAEDYVVEDDEFEVRFIINAANMDDKSTIIMEGWRCADNDCPDAWGFKECTEETILWSDATNWPDDVLPVEGDYVEIETGWNMIYDIEGDSPLFDMVKL